MEAAHQSDVRNVRRCRQPEVRHGVRRVDAGVEEGPFNFWRTPSWSRLHHLQDLRGALLSRDGISERQVRSVPGRHETEPQGAAARAIQLLKQIECRVGKGVYPLVSYVERLANQRKGRRMQELVDTERIAKHVGNAVVFLASNSTSTTGATIPIDGGLPEAFPR